MWQHFRDRIHNIILKKKRGKLRCDSVSKMSEDGGNGDSQNYNVSDISFSTNIEVGEEVKRW
jgi:hypothetical protein